VGPPRRVLMVIDSLNGGGAERYVADLAIALRSRGWEVAPARAYLEVMETEGIQSCHRFGQHFAGPGIWPGEITSGTSHGRLPPVTSGHLAASGG
jgi:hypothetical protein